MIQLLVLPKLASLLQEDGWCAGITSFSQTATASCKKDSHSWNCEKLVMTHVNRDIYHTSRAGPFTASKSCEEIFGLFYRYAKDWPLSGLLHLPEATSSTGMPAVLQRHNVLTLKHDEKGRDANINVSHTKLSIPVTEET